jgi:hypothetical protein
VLSIDARLSAAHAGRFAAALHLGDIGRHMEPRM